MSNYPHWNAEKFLFVTLLLLASLSAIVGIQTCQRIIKHKEAHAVDEQFLNAWERSLNEEHFGNNLPPVEVFYRRPNRPEDLIGETECVINPYGPLPKSCEIFITPKYNIAQAIAVETLIHETCHVETYAEIDPHGLQWTECMMRMAKEGAFKGIW